MTCALAPPASNSALTILVGWCAPVTRVTAMTASATETGSHPTVWVSLASFITSYLQLIRKVVAESLCCSKFPKENNIPESQILNLPDLVAK